MLKRPHFATSLVSAMPRAKSIGGGDGIGGDSCFLFARESGIGHKYRNRKLHGSGLGN